MTSPSPSPLTLASPAGTFPLLGRRVQISGSASATTEPDLIAYAHDMTSAMVKGVMAAGGGIVVGIGKEPRPLGCAADAPSLVFDWTILEAVAESLKVGIHPWPSRFGLPIVVVTSEKAFLEIPDRRRPLFEELLRSGFLRVESIMPGSRAAAFLRERQAAFGDALAIIGGGTGVEHSADLYLSRRKPVVPFDLALGASRDDGTGGALRLSKEARSDPGRFFRFCPAFAHQEGAALAEIATRNGATAASDVAGRAISLLTKTERPAAFYVRLLNTAHAKFAVVESFFREVVDPVVGEAGMRHIEIGTSTNDYAFMNVAIFESLHFSSLAIVDITGERPNCFIELGYALGNANRVLVTAEEGTPLPFDQQAIPCHFWKPGDTVTDRKQALSEFWEKQINRTPLVKTR
jgi:hypothetical protein